MKRILMNAGLITAGTACVLGYIKYNCDIDCSVRYERTKNGVSRISQWDSKTKKWEHVVKGEHR